MRRVEGRIAAAVEGARVVVVSAADLDALIAERDRYRAADEAHLEHIRVLTGKG